MAIDSTKGQVAAAWVNFDGTGTVAIREDFNVSSITDNGTGDYTVSFTNAMSNDDYSVIVSCRRVAGASEMSSSLYFLSTSSVRVLSLQENNGSNRDTDTYCVAIFGKN